MIFKHSESKILHDNSVVRVISISINPLHTSQDTLIKSLSRDKIQIFKHSSWTYFMDPEHLHGEIRTFSEFSPSKHILQIFSSIFSTGKLIESAQGTTLDRKVSGFMQNNNSYYWKNIQINDKI